MKNIRHKLQFFTSEFNSNNFYRKNIENWLKKRIKMKANSNGQMIE